MRASEPLLAPGHEGVHRPLDVRFHDNCLLFLSGHPERDWYPSRIFKILTSVLPPTFTSLNPHPGSRGRTAENFTLVKLMDCTCGWLAHWRSLKGINMSLTSHGPWRHGGRQCFDLLAERKLFANKSSTLIIFFVAPSLKSYFGLEKHKKILHPICLLNKQRERDKGEDMGLTLSND